MRRRLAWPESVLGIGRQLAPHYSDVFRGVDPQPDAVAAHLHDGDFDLAGEVDALVTSSREY